MNKGALSGANHATFRAPGVNLTPGQVSAGGRTSVGGKLDPVSFLHLTNTFIQTDTPLDPSVGTPLLIEHNVVYDYPHPVTATSLFGPRALINLEGTSQYNVSADNLFGGPPIGIADKLTVKNRPGTSVNSTPAWSIISARTYLADAATITAQQPDSGNGPAAFYDSNVYISKNSGHYDGTTNSVVVGSYISNPFVLGNVQFTGRRGFEARDVNQYLIDLAVPFGADGLVDGTIGTNVGFYVGHMSAGTLNVGLWNASATVEPSLALTVAAATVITVSSTNLNLATAANANVSLTGTPWITAGVDGQRVRIVNTNATGTITLPNGTGVIWADGVDLVLVPGASVDIFYSSFTASWGEPTWRTARRLYQGTLTGATTLTGTLTSTGATVSVGDGTASDGWVTLAAANSVGVPSAAVQVFKNTADTQPVARMSSVNNVGSWQLGAGGSTATSVAVTWTGAGAATVTGTLTIPAPVLTGHPVIEGVTSTGATGTGKFVFDASPTLTGHPTIEGVTATGATGTGNLVFSASPTFTGTPVLPPLKIWDTTSTDGSVRIGTSNIGVPLGSVDIFAVDGDANPVVRLLNLNGTGSVSLGGGGASALDVVLSRTGAAAATFTGVITMTSPVLVTPAIGVATGTSLAATGKVTSSGTAGIGYATGAGGTVTQATSRVTGVTLSKLSGQITLFSTTLAADTDVSFVLTNTAIAATDIMVFNVVSGAAVKGGYDVNAICAAGSATITVHNKTPTITATEAPVIGFVVIKGVTA